MVHKTVMPMPHAKTIFFFCLKVAGNMVYGVQNVQCSTVSLALVCISQKHSLSVIFVVTWV